MKDIPLLKAEDIEVRVSQVFVGKGVSLLLYKNARCDMRMLDEIVGAENWQREHYECKGNLFCRVGIRTESGEWVWKSDCGSESYTEKEKGESSDSFKRACVNWGLGRELYTSPFIWVKADKCVITDDKKCKTAFAVCEVDYTPDRSISYLTIVDKKTGDLVYKFGKPPAKDFEPADKLTPEAKAWTVTK